MATTTSDQLALDEKVVEDAALLSLLENRQTAKDDVSEAQAELRAADKLVQGEIEKLDIGVDAAVRIGRFRIARTIRRGRAVSFESSDKEVVSIALVEDAA